MFEAPRCLFVQITSAFVVMAASAQAADIGTGFTYQGSLAKPAGTPVSGTCDSQFGGGGSTAAGGGAHVLLRAVRTIPPGGVVTGNDITIENVPTLVVVEGYYGGWGLAQGLSLISLAIDPASLASGTGGALTRASIPCTDPPSPNSPQCKLAFGVVGYASDLRCNQSFANECDNFYQEDARMNWDGFRFCQPADLYCAGLSSVFGGTVDPGTDQYGLTAVFQVPADASGTYELTFDGPDFLNTYLQLWDGSETPVTMNHARIIVHPTGCCFANGTCATGNAAFCLTQGGVAAPAPCQGDLNGNGVDDVCGGDCDHDGTLDPFELSNSEKDCDFDGICNGVAIDTCPPANLGCKDCNGNRIPDGCEPDCNNNGVPDSCDVNTGTSQDCNGNHRPDECELGGCCLNTAGNTSVFEGCQNTTLQECVAAAGIFRGPCRPCAVQNVKIVDEGNGEVFVHVIGRPIDCLAEPPAPRGDCQPGDPKIDVWKSDANLLMCHNFGALGQSIPADFFGVGSEMVTSSLCLKGQSLGIPGFGNADTLVSRNADPFDRCSLPSPAQSTVDVHVTELSLVSTAPLTVTYNNGQPTEQWDVAVDLSAVSPPIGTLTAVKTHCNGGTYTSVLHVQPRFTFTKVGSPGTVRVLDTGLAAPPIPYVTLNQPLPGAAWVHDVDPNLGLTGDPCSSFHAGIEDQVQQTDCDCNANGLRDKCDLEQATSLDCNANARPDSCDIASGFSVDANSDGIPDECAPVLPDAPTKGTDDKCVNGANAGLGCAQQSDCPGGFCRLKNRFITTVIPATAAAHGIQVDVVSIDANSVATPGNYNGTDRWVGAPSLNVNDGISPPFNAAKVQCAFASQDWSAIGQIHLYGDVIVPLSTYDLSMCSSATGPCSTALRIDTGKFGDVIPPTSTVNFQDVNSIVAKFQGTPAGPSKTRTKLTNSIVNPANPINFQEVSACVSAFQSKAFKTVVTAAPVICP